MMIKKTKLYIVASGDYLSSLVARAYIYRTVRMGLMLCMKAVRTSISVDYIVFCFQVVNTWQFVAGV